MIQRNFEMIETNGVTLRTVVEGEGPLLILTHGFPQGWYLWRHQIDFLVNEGYKVAVPDQRGYGASSCPPNVADYNMRHLADDAAGIAKALGYDEFISIGHDFGSMVAFYTALLHEKTCKAVLGMAVPYLRGLEAEYPPYGDDQFWYIHYFQEEGVAESEIEEDIEKSLLSLYYSLSADSPKGTWMAQMKKPSKSRLLDALCMPKKLPSWLTREDMDYYVHQFKKSGFRGPLNWYRNIATMDALVGDIVPDIANKKIRQPAAFIAGAQDEVLDYAPSWRKAMPGWFENLKFIELIDGAGHWVQVEQPEKTNRLIKRFLDQVKS
jgi:pimeloyl-ACP methyl ester carboxylesterase